MGEGGEIHINQQFNTSSKIADFSIGINIRNKQSGRARVQNLRKSADTFNEIYNTHLKMG